MAALQNLPKDRLLPANLSMALFRLFDPSLRAWDQPDEPAPKRTMIDGRVRYAVSDLLQFAAKHPDCTGSTPDIQHMDFEQFLLKGSSEDVWIFAFVDVDVDGFRRPIDLIGCLDIPLETALYAACRPLSLRDYLSTKAAYLGRVDDLRQARRVAAERADRARSLGDLKAYVNVPKERVRS